MSPQERQQLIALRIQAAAFIASLDAILGPIDGLSAEVRADEGRSGCSHPPDTVRRVGGAGFGTSADNPGLNICGLCGDTVT
jgi:hypothetical protein